ncbi:MAG: zinc-dependent alcohol dehydrogenase family protein [Sphingomonadaceae bacterium]|nr:zinc-dependent alcohol dehydrogenase family protein [Sphingomonadaceae bacterium]
MAIHDVADAPPPGRGEIGVSMRLAPINPADRLLIAGSYSLAVPGDEVVGAEGVGVIDAVGAGVDDLSPGDRVLCLERGNWTQRRTVAAERVIRVPHSLADGTAAVLRINPPTARRLLACTALERGDWIVLNGAGSMVGRLLVFLARAMGVRSLCVVRDVASAKPLLAALGADAVVADGSDLEARAREIIGPCGARLALDCVAGEATGRLAACLGEAGLLVVYGNLSGTPCTIPPALLTGRAGVRVEGFSLRPAEAGAGRAALQPMFDELAEVLGAEPAVIPRHRLFPVSRISEALAHSGPERTMIALGPEAWT